METPLLTYPEGCRIGRFIRREKRFFVLAELDAVVNQEKDDVGSLLRRGHQARQEKPAQEECLFHRIVIYWYKGKGSVFIGNSNGT